ncbi:hypothetical protein LTR62_006406 [Meristemomyces frigidus]|uniref:BTB domain-containing protein n=1 Tax=Meristemomyces frigidus TaxID=1508187 RepID=A0AAN7TCB5_9PEZI|nr:hypothetical protein LTR62_006406 [Meristemomyces frigidus]
MFSSSNKNKSYRDSFSHRAGKATSTKKQKSFKDYAPARKTATVHQHQASTSRLSPPASSKSQSSSPPTSPNLNSAIVTISVGPSHRLFAAHEDILSKSPYFAHHIRAQFFEAAGGKRIELPHEEPEVFSAVLEYLYKGDYSPKLYFDKKRGSWALDDEGGGAGGESTVVCNIKGVGGNVLKDTVIYVRPLPTQTHKRPTHPIPFTNTPTH